MCQSESDEKSDINEFVMSDQAVQCVLSGHAPNWDPIPVSETGIPSDCPDEVPNDVTEDDGPFAWEYHQDHSVVIGIKYTSVKGEFKWTFGGDGSAIHICDSFDQIRKKAARYLYHQTEKPSSMITG